MHAVFRIALPQPNNVHTWHVTNLSLNNAVTTWDVWITSTKLPVRWPKCSPLNTGICPGIILFWNNSTVYKENLPHYLSVEKLLYWNDMF